MFNVGKNVYSGVIINDKIYYLSINLSCHLYFEILYNTLSPQISEYEKVINLQVT